MSDIQTVQKYRQALTTGLILSLGGEFTLWIIYSPIWYPEYFWQTLSWVLSCGLGMGAVIGAITCLLIVDRLSQTQAIIASFALTAIVCSVCTVSCFLMDLQTNYWGAATHPQEFLIGGFISSTIGAILYAWLVFGRNSKLVTQK